MKQKVSRGLRLPALVAGMVVIAAGCGSSNPTASPLGTPAAIGTAPNVTVVRWFVGIGEGTDPSQVAAERAFVASYNAQHNGIYINLEVVPTATAMDTLRSEVADGVGPDIVGPLGTQGRYGMSDEFLDLTAEMTKNNFNQTLYPAAMVNYFKDARGRQLGLPYLIDPGFIFYNKDIFAKAGLPDLPPKAGDEWNGQPWTWDTLASIAQKLTVDAKGKKATDAGFDPTKIVQYGFDFEWADLRRVGGCFASGSLVAGDGSATIPSGWLAAWNWYYNAIWTLHIAPTARASNSAYLGSGATITSGNVAMAASWSWAIPTYGSLDAAGHSDAKFKTWDMAVMPSYNGITSSPMDATTFEILKGTAHPDQAFQAMMAIMADKNLQSLYGGMPAIGADQAVWFRSYDEHLASIFPSNEVTWSVLQEMENYPSSPNPEMDTPNPDKVAALTDAFYNRLRSVQGLDVTAEAGNLQTSLQRAFDQAAAASPS